MSTRQKRAKEGWQDRRPQLPAIYPSGSGCLPVTVLVLIKRDKKKETNSEGQRNHKRIGIGRLCLLAVAALIIGLTYIILTRTVWRETRRCLFGYGAAVVLSGKHEPALFHR